MFYERPSSYLFVKTFQKEDGSKFVHFESVTVSQDGMEVSISSHIIRENQLKNKLKSDRLLYKATALDAPANTSAEQPIVGGSLSSDGKDKEKVSSEQGKEEKSVGGDKPSEASLSLSEPKDEEPLPILPKKEENTLNPIVKAAENYKKDHPLTEGEIRSSDVDDIAKDMAVDYLNGEVTDDLHRAVYESIYEKVKDAKMKNTTKQADDKTEATEAPNVGSLSKPY